MSSSATPPKRVPRYAPDQIDFKILASQDADFDAVYSEKGRLDFQDPSALQQLTKSLLKLDFGLKLDLPDDRLCPPVPVRYNYVHWVQDLIDTSSEALNDRYDPAREVIGLDIGVGASCIYPLLATVHRQSWKMLGTDIDQHSLSYAQRNVDLNGLSKRIRLSLSTADGPLIPLKALNVEYLGFVMCNPPFYTSAAELHASQAFKGDKWSAACTGAEVEMITPGGDLGFALRMLEESTKLRTKVQWYTCMLGKLTSVIQLYEKIKEVGVTNTAVTVLQAGNQTKRWAVGWSFDEWRPQNHAARSGQLIHAILPAPTGQTIAVKGVSKTQLGEKVNATMSALELKWQWRPKLAAGVAMAKDAVWTRAWRRKKMSEKIGLGRMAAFKLKDIPMTETGLKEDDAESGEDDGDESVVLGVKIEVKDGEVEVRWLRGHDQETFVSFCGMLQCALRT